MSIHKYGRFFAVLDEKEDLVCLTVYRKGAMEVIRRLSNVPKSEVCSKCQVSKRGN